MGDDNDLILWKPVFFIGTSYRKSLRAQGQYKRDDLTGIYTTDGLLEWGCLSYFGVRLSRYLHSHFILKIGTEGGINPHGHAIAFSPDLTRWGKEKMLSNKQRAKLWSKGRLWVQPYDLSRGKAGVIYTTARHHNNTELDRWVLCPRQSNACRDDRCPYEHDRGMKGHIIGF